MMQERYFSDEELVAYLDGENDFAPVDEIAAALKTDIALAKRLEGLRVNTAAIAESFKALARDDRPLPDLPEVPVAKLRYGMMAVAAMVALVIGFGAGFSTSNMSTPGWREYVAAYQALYINATLAHVNQSQTRQQDELNRVSSAIGTAIRVDALNVSPEMDYKRAQILGFKGQALVQLAFLTSTGHPVALCIIRSDRGAAAPVVSKSMEGMSSAYWSKGNYQYLLIGGTDQSMVTRLAEKFSSLDL
ncbi:MAG: hypothetical protein GY948_19935 [Alphaproteobacteria bacterium]|nr:hypothetical protein [Alphaproteobacteria bacterium]